MMAYGWRMRGADTGTESAVGVVGACTLRCMGGTSAWAAACVRALRDWAWRRGERAGRRRLGRSAAVGSAAVWGLGFVWLFGGVVRVLAAGGGVVGDSVCGAGASIMRRTLDRGLCCVQQRVRDPSPTRPFAARCGRFAGVGLFGGRGDAGRDEPRLP
jgi:hypothetical protein